MHRCSLVNLAGVLLAAESVYKLTDFSVKLGSPISRSLQLL